VLINRITNRVTIPEGTISVDIYRRLSDQTKIPVADFTAAAKNPVALGIPDWWLTRTDGKKMLRPPSIEGFLYPDTYELPPHPTAAGVLRMMVNRLPDRDRRSALRRQRAGQPAHHAVRGGWFAASIAQVEATYDKDMPGVARVLYNRA